MRLWLVLAIAGGCAKSVRLVEPTPVVVTGEAAADDTPDPPPKPKRVEVKQDRIDVTETIQFDPSSSRISDDSHGLLDEIAAVIAKHPEITRIRVEGHTDNTGDAPHNLNLSKKRAAAVVKYLVEKGIEASRLVPEGFGQTKPIAGNDTDEGRAQNRRVAFVIVARSNAKPDDDGDK